MNEAVQEQAPATLTKGKTKAAQTTSNFLADVASQIENLTKPKALNRAHKLVEEIDNNSFELGGVLKVIHENGWYEGHESFDVFVTNELGFKPRKARYLIEIYDNLVTKQVPWEKVKDLGWTKLKDLARYLTAENVDEWVGKVQALSYTEMMKLLKGNIAEGEGGKVKATSDTHKLTFTLHADQLETVQQGLAKAKGETGTDYDAVALENVMTGYLGNAVGVTASAEDRLKGALTELGWEQGLAMIEAVYKAQWDIEVNIDATVPAALDTGTEA